MFSWSTDRSTIWSVDSVETLLTALRCHRQKSMVAGAVNIRAAMVVRLSCFSMAENYWWCNYPDMLYNIGRPPAGWPTQAEAMYARYKVRCKRLGYRLHLINIVVSGTLHLQKDSRVGGKICGFRRMIATIAYSPLAASSESRRKCYYFPLCHRFSSLCTKHESIFFGPPIRCPHEACDCPSNTASY